MVLEGREARPLERFVAQEGVTDRFRGRHRDFAYAPFSRPICEPLLQLPFRHPFVGHYAADRVRGEHAMDLRVGQENCDRLVAHDCTRHLLDAIEFLKVHGHREHEDAARVVDFLCARARREVFNVEENLEARADLAAALLDKLAHVLSDRPRVRKEEVEALGRLEARQMQELTLIDGPDFDKRVALDVAEPAQLLLLAVSVQQRQGVKCDLDDDHGEAKKDKEQENACGIFPESVRAANGFC
mmetsp:Transcript_15655/g.42402  ORF Transcript_15655/g.42402 Transcript_15655/m.42402 type:complete len:243 (+) Transcript_15655:783-1511(+)|eukprot:2105079-Prymnesium_polylepis.2